MIKGPHSRKLVDVWNAVEKEDSGFPSVKNIRFHILQNCPDIMPFVCILERLDVEESICRYFGSSLPPIFGGFDATGHSMFDKRHYPEAVREGFHMMLDTMWDAQCGTILERDLRSEGGRTLHAETSYLPVVSPDGNSTMFIMAVDVLAGAPVTSTIQVINNATAVFSDGNYIDLGHELPLTKPWLDKIRTNIVHWND